MGQKIGKLRHEVDTGFIVINTDMDVHAANQRATGNAAEVALEFAVALFVSEMLLVPIGERVTGYGKWRQSVPFCDAGDGGAQPRQISPGFRDSPADPCAHFDLALEKLGTDLILKLGNTLCHESFRRGDEVESLAIDKKILFFDAEGEAGLMMAHGLI